ncbi:hypothetical protein LA080_008248 [Diaporthe eres]|uniref:Uncharacterized protein n=1 Tax=Diaporthe vaccinii TaxID=105482 RepID=A0ABR4E4X6_9PEZI|nr:hypothetical protein LA080_008248 [Diaporthe eres]
MDDQPDDNSSDGGPYIKFRDVDWTGPVVVPGPLLHGYVDPYGSDTGTVDHRLEQHVVDSPVEASSVCLIRTNSTIGQGVSEGRIRDSLELPKYMPPNPLGVRRASQAGSTAAVAAAAEAAEAATPAAQPAGKEGEEPPKMTPDVFAFRVPATMLRGDEGLRRRGGLPSYALNVVQPYPNPSGLKKKRAAPVVLGALPERLLKRPKEGPVIVSNNPDGSVVTAIQVQDDESKAGDANKPGDGSAAKKAPAGEAPRRWRPVEALFARKVRKDKAKGEKEAAAPEPKGKALEAVEIGESARGKPDLVAGYESQQGRDGEQTDDGTTNAVRKARKAVVRYLKVTA